MLLIGSVVSASAQVRHIDPSQLKVVDPDPGKLFDLYGVIMDHIASENFTGASYWVGWALKVDSLPETNMTLSSYVSTLTTENSEVNSTKGTISEASKLVEFNRDAEALSSLNDAELRLGEANRTLTVLESSSSGLGALFKVSDSPLLVGVSEIRALLVKYSEMIGAMRTRAQYYQSHPLVETTLTISSNSSLVLVGSALSISGELSGGGSAMGGRSITLLIDGTLSAKPVTDSVGRFKIILRVPYIYRDSMNVSAVYSPFRTDEAVYASAQSNVLKIGLLYYTPLVGYSFPSEVYPGNVMNFNGSLSFGVHPLSLPIEVSAFGLTTSQISGDDGRFSGQIVVPSDQPDGDVVVSLNSLPLGVYGPAHAAVTFTVMRIPSVIEVSSPPWVISGMKLRVDGNVRVQGQPINGCSLDVRGPSGETNLVSSRDGSFVAWVDVPFPITTASYAYSVSADPGVPSVSGSRAVGSVLVINVLPLIALPVIFVVLAEYTSRGIRWGSVKPTVQSVVAPNPTLVSGNVVQGGGPITIQGLFSSVVATVASLHGLIFRPSSTIREWLSDVKPVVGASIYEALESIGLTYERFLYGAPSEPDGGYIRQLYDRVRSLFENEAKSSSN